jgi:protein associated with RNAse G/E
LGEWIVITALAFKIRGIYTTALTCFFLEKGMAIASPSEETAERFRKERFRKERFRKERFRKERFRKERFRKERFRRRRGAAFREPAQVEIRDLEGRQGVLIEGSREACSQAAGLIRESFLDAIFRETGDADSYGMAVEFPYLTKSAMDEQRNKIVPTVLNHHRLRIIASEYVDLMEKKELSNHPERRKSVSENLEKRLVWGSYVPGKEIGLVHVKLDGQVLSLSEGEVIQADFNKRRLVLKRSKFKGRFAYDGLDVPKEEGDYAITEVREGEWFYRHTYFRRNGDVIGWYYNINTPVEFYPEAIRYVDLDIDVVEWPGGRAEVKDEAILEKQFESGRLSARLKDLAVKTARDLLARTRSCDADHHHFGLTS